MSCAPLRPQISQLPSARRTTGRQSFLLRLIAMLALTMGLVQLVACGGAAPVARDSRRLDDDGLTGPARYAQALKTTALARVEARAGADQLAAQHLKAASRLGGESGWLIEQAEAEERAKLFAEARETAERALTRDLTPIEKDRVERLLARVVPQVPAGLMRVTVLVRPEGARVELSRNDAKRRRSVERVLVGSGSAWLAPGTWAMETSAKGFSSELRTVQVGADGSLVAIALMPEDQGPALANNPDGMPVEIAPEPAVVVAPEPQPAPVPPTDVAGPTKSTEPAKPIEPAQPIEVAKPIEPPVEVVQPSPLPPQEKVDAGVTKREEPARVSWIHRVGPYAVAGLGVAALGTGAFFGSQALSDASSANGLSPKAKSYDTQIDALASSANQNALLSNSLFVAGGVLLAAGTVWWFLAPADEPPAPRKRAAVDAASPDDTMTAWLPQVGVSPQSVLLHWTF